MSLNFHFIAYYERYFQSSLFYEIFAPVCFFLVNFQEKRKMTENLPSVLPPDAIDEEHVRCFRSG